MLILKRIFILIIVSTIVWNSGGYYFCFKVLQAGIREEMEREARKTEVSELIPLEFSINDFREISWVKKDKEFMKDGELFDVVKIIKTDISIEVYCINDKREKQLFADFQKASGVDAGLNRMARILQKLTIPVSVNQETQGQTFLYFEGCLLFDGSTYVTSNGFTRVITPPPDFIS